MDRKNVLTNRKINKNCEILSLLKLGGSIVKPNVATLVLLPVASQAYLAIQGIFLCLAVVGEMAMSKKMGAINETDIRKSAYPMPRVTSRESRGPAGS